MESLGAWKSRYPVLVIGTRSSFSVKHVRNISNHRAMTSVCISVGVFCLRTTRSLAPKSGSAICTRDTRLK